MTAAFMLLAAQASQIYAQCTDWTANNGNVWGDLNTAFGGAPCDDGSGCQFLEVNAFQIFASEAYVLDGFVTGGEYAFSACNGAGAGSWVIDFTIVAPSGAIDAFGAGDGDGCTISWTATEDGTYTIIINEENNCGGGANTGTANGFPAMTCLSGTACPEPIDIGPCNAGVLLTTGMFDLCLDSDTIDFEVMNDTVPEGFALNLLSVPVNGGSGAVGGAFTFPLPSNPFTFDSDLGGALSANNFPIYVGTWGFLATVLDANGNSCSQTADTLFVTFGPTGSSCDPSLNVCNAGTLQTIGEVSICDAAGTFEITATNDTIPAGGGYGFTASNILGGTGGTGAALAFLSGTSSIDYNSDLNGFLSANQLPALSGTWVFRGLVADGTNTVCSVTADSLIVSFGTESPSIIDITNNGLDELTVNATGGVAPYSFLWDDPAAQTTMTAVGLESGVVYTVTVVDANGCFVFGESSFSVSTNSISSLNELNISPNPSNGNFLVELSFEENSLIEIDVMDITGKVIREAAQEASLATFNFNLEDVSAGMYFINITVGQESMTQKIVVSK